MDNSTTIESSTIPEIIKGSQQLKITNFSLLKGIGSGKYITSEPFSVGGHDWAIYFYPDGKNEDENGAYVSVFIVLISDTKDAKALFELALLDQTGNEKHMVHSQFQGMPPSEAYTLQCCGSMWGYKNFIKKIDLETSDYLRDDCLSMNCRIGVVNTHMEKNPDSCTLNCQDSSVKLP